MTRIPTITAASALAIIVLAILFALGLATAEAGAEQPGSEPAADSVSFERDIQPLLQAHCYECHGERRPKGGLRLDARSAAFRGGDSAEPGIVPGDAVSSHIMRALEGRDGAKQMPPGGEPLSDEQIALFRAWIESGADWPIQDGEEAVEDPFLQRDHWSLEPVARPEVPAERADPWCGNEIDAFILRALEDKNLSPTPEADRRRLIRRVFFNLHGLVPTPEQMDHYLNDTRPDWYARMVDDLLDSPRYGERWARHWLDIVRYAETNGFETNTQRPNAYVYRDYVIRAINEDKPYDRFILDQLAGDTTGHDAATGFLVAGPKDIVGSPDPVLTAMQRSNELADMVNAASTTFMGLTVACARCHHHKFDPILHSDYFAMEAVFAGVIHGERPLPDQRPTDSEQSLLQRIAEIDAKIDAQTPLASTAPDASPTRREVNAVRNVERFEPVRAKHVRIVIHATGEGYEPCIDEVEVFTAADAATPNTNVALHSAGGTASASSTAVGNPKHQLGHLIDGRYGNDYSWISQPPMPQWAQVTLAEEVLIDRVVWSRDRTGGYVDRLAVDYRIEVAGESGDWRVVASSADRVDRGSNVQAVVESEDLKALRSERESLENQLAPRLAYAGLFMQPEPTHRLYRGDPMQPREEVAPDTISVLGSLDLDINEPEQNRRLAFAKSLIAPDHPLTARVMVNRIWQYHFGEGLVSTPSDFGAMGALPTHPELLDYLASRFVESGWSIKAMHRLILNSSTFKQDSVPNEEAMQIDSASQLLWRFPPRRHEAEVIRDSLLRVTGKLDLSMYGPGFSFFDIDPNYVRVYHPKQSFGPEDWRRMVYGTQVRMERDETFGGFDCPDGGQPAPKRSRSTTALQALSLFNSPFVLQQADFLADRLREEAGQAPETQVSRAYELMYGREPNNDERTACVAFIDEHGLAAFCRVLVNTNEFLFVE